MLSLFLMLMPLCFMIGMGRAFYSFNPFVFPYFTVDMSDSLTEYLHTPGVMAQLEAHNAAVADWRKRCEDFIDANPLKKHRRAQYDSVAKEQSPFKINGKSYCFNELWNIYIGQIKEAS